MSKVSDDSQRTGRPDEPRDLRQDLKLVPNVLTIVRIAFIFIATAIFFSGNHVLGIVLGVLAGITDYLDGYLARKLNLVTPIGELLDQLADVVFESTALLLVVSTGFITPIVLVAYLFREFWVTTIRRFVTARGLNISSGFLGKLKTNVLMWSFVPSGVSLAGFWPQLEPALGVFGRCSIVAGIALGYISGWRYTKQFARVYGKPPIA
ncbi:MAG: CDP-alcohol phosphatidyltransferase family protein [Deltaproteobacteria bacterium]|nr:CDP-alcohol phosphatidyltransferase family protein [Deltaproteobacteria bacterium]